MTPEEAALCLRDDPTFATSSRADQEEEAALLLGSDDPLDIALAIEAALARKPDEARRQTVISIDRQPVRCAAAQSGPGAFAPDHPPIDRLLEPVDRDGHVQFLGCHVVRLDRCFIVRGEP